jgi:Tfp pilus assembly protein PilF
MKRTLGIALALVFLFGFCCSFTHAQQSAPTSAPKMEQPEAFDVAMKHYRQRHYAQAIEEFNQIVQTDPSNAAAFYFMGYAHYTLKHHQEALEAFSKAFQANPKFDPSPYMWLQ